MRKRRSMIRKVIIVMLTLTAVAMITLSVLARFSQGYWQFGDVRTHNSHGLSVFIQRGTVHIEYCGPWWADEENPDQQLKLDAYGLRMIRTPNMIGLGLRDALRMDLEPDDLLLTASFGLILSVYPAYCFISGPVRRRRRRKRGLCVRCGYDLRGSPERCPECGIAAV